jgi:hypothetical protein
MDMLSYFLGRLAGNNGGTGGGSSIIDYDNISYGKDPNGNDALILEDDGITYYATCEYENGKLKSIMYQGQTIELQYDGDRLISIGDTEIDLSSAPTAGDSGDTEELEQLIDESGILGSDEGTIMEKIEHLIDKAKNGNSASIDENGVITFGGSATIDDNGIISL